MCLSNISAGFQLRNLNSQIKKLNKIVRQKDEIRSTSNQQLDDFPHPELPSPANNDI